MMMNVRARPRRRARHAEIGEDIPGGSGRGVAPAVPRAARRRREGRRGARDGSPVRVVVCSGRGHDDLRDETRFGPGGGRVGILKVVVVVEARKVGLR